MSLVNWSRVRELHVNLCPYGYDITKTNKFSHVLPTIFRKAVNLTNLTNSGPIEDSMEGLSLATSDTGGKTLRNLDQLGCPGFPLNQCKITEEENRTILRLNIKLKKVSLRVVGNVELQILHKFKETLEVVWLIAYGPDFKLPPLPRLKRLSVQDQVTSM
ncbi:hypothetical protein Fcan01_16307 [Folsomia candida]|uniref:Uncharacterized protein n=1 Tax=Folsomia candida TaxID=158441 RepID=A0A226DVZ4_FOLCA|nr:hypothetical protein Fcan01_16307 [Folsomia candida]